MKKINKPLVTAVITTYKREAQILERALKSILNQTYNNLEIIIVNDYPEGTENNLEIEKMISKYSSFNVQYIVVDKNGGACKARNIGLIKSKGDYIGFLDDDDEWLPEKVEKMVSEFLKEKDIAIVYSNSITALDDKKQERTRFSDIQPSGYIHNQLFMSNIIGSCSFPIFDKNKLLEFNGFSEDMPAMQDWELYLRISKKYKVKYINEPLTRYHKYEGDRISKNSNNRVNAYNKIFERFQDDILKDKSISYSFYKLGANVYSINGQTKKAIQLFIKALKLKPKKIKMNFIMLIKIIVRIFYRKNNL